MNRIKQLFQKKGGEILNVYFTAGHPNLHDTVNIIHNLYACGVDLIEVGIPYSDPLADGLTIQKSAQQALSNGMTLQILFEQLSESRKDCQIPMILMGNYNQVLQYGDERFFRMAKSCGVDGFIIPDLPMNTYISQYKNLFESLDLVISFLVTPETEVTRIKQAASLSEGFLYVVSKSSITGSSDKISPDQEEYFHKMNRLDLETPALMGFGIHDEDTFKIACRYFNGGIIGSAFIRALEGKGSIDEKVKSFVHSVRP